jgi:hypothetical protein
MGAIDQRFENAYKIACEWFDKLVAQFSEESETASFEIEEAITAAAVALSVNYRIGNNEASLLGVLGSHGVVGEVLQAMIDWPTILEWSKKNEATGPDTAG